MGEYTRIDDLSVIRGMGVGLGRIKDAFDGLDRLRGQYEDDFGDSGLAGQFGEFAGNWERHREELADEVARLAAIARAAAKTYDGVDGELARALRAARAPKNR
ncbi:hypothetical protein [Streptomyces spectabilis]|uniref:GAF domain-containing protein n=1 Tax=Streptomyces spectabilis TaxID=68270 RepID=A0A7W8ARY6_STRST|nr:hypothetical protein [Streptomyces spectabilis]MBB5103442.1 GAF domain-containing protein [Streptomyces spectabilis]MCI3902632.1 hypothetical protein [Streptomyces spectabilis]